ncbi:hypothetical protein BpHYR1_031823 [Brachionus plicatilis]|uniref:Uncharacterized protein n=1 Tax=Brachionus plicatilis TaxID=10195 RepID=A0A3M7SYG6_BRAPC|nr:hypothetical protein BpHYR1_031823 [Brachionus plicatilis]
MSETLFLEEEHAHFVDCEKVRKMENFNLLIYLASADGNLRMLKFLIENDGDIFKRDNLGQTILHWAVENDSESIVDYLANKYPNLIKLKCYYGYTPCHKAAKRGSIKIIQLLLEKDLSMLDSQDNDGNTMLHLATKSGHTQLIKYLVGKNANSDIKNEKGKRPFDIAVQNKYKDALNILY